MSKHRKITIADIVLLVLIFVTCYAGFVRFSINQRKSNFMDRCLAAGNKYDACEYDWEQNHGADSVLP